METWKKHSVKLLAQDGLAALNFDLSTKVQRDQTHEVMTLALVIWEMFITGAERKDVVVAALNTISARAEWFRLTFPTHLQSQKDKSEDQWGLIMEHVAAEHLTSSPEFSMENPSLDWFNACVLNIADTAKSSQSVVVGRGAQDAHH